MKKTAIVAVFVVTLVVGAATESDPTRSLIAASVLALAMGLSDLAAGLRSQRAGSTTRDPTASP